MKKPLFLVGILFLCASCVQSMRWEMEQIQIMHTDKPMAHIIDTECDDLQLEFFCEEEKVYGYINVLHGTLFPAEEIKQTTLTIVLDEEKLFLKTSLLEGGQRLKIDNTDALSLYKTLKSNQSFTMKIANREEYVPSKGFSVKISQDQNVWEKLITIISNRWSD